MTMHIDDGHHTTLYSAQHHNLHLIDTERHISILSYEIDCIRRRFTKMVSKLNRDNFEHAFSIINQMHRGGHLIYSRRCCQCQKCNCMQFHLLVIPAMLCR